MSVPCKQEPIEGVDFYKSKVTLSRKEREDEKNSIIRKVLEQIDVKPTPIKSVDELKRLYPEATAPEEGYDGLYLIESGTDEGYLYFFDNGTKKWTKSIIYEDSPAVEELKASKVNKDMIDWGTMPETITDKKTFYKEVSNVFATADHSIYMFGTPEELQRLWDIWGKPEGLKATHAYIAINPISNKSSRHAFIMWVFSSNYANPYFRVISGYAGSYVSANDKGWVSVNSLATPPTLDAVDLLSMIDVEGHGIVVDLSEDGQHLHIHLDNNVDAEHELAVMMPNVNAGSYAQEVTLAEEEVGRARGLRVWVKFPFKGNSLVKHFDIRFVRNPDGSYINRWFVTDIIPDPQAFNSDKLTIQYDTELRDKQLAIKTSNESGLISSDIQIVRVLAL